MVVRIEGQEELERIIGENYLVVVHFMAPKSNDDDGGPSPLNALSPMEDVMLAEIEVQRLPEICEQYGVTPGKICMFEHGKLHGYYMSDDSELRRNILIRKPSLSTISEKSECSSSVQQTTNGSENGEISSSARTDSSPEIPTPRTVASPRKGKKFYTDPPLLTKPSLPPLEIPKSFSSSSEDEGENDSIGCKKATTPTRVKCYTKRGRDKKADRDALFDIQNPRPSTSAALVRHQAREKRDQNRVRVNKEEQLVEFKSSKGRVIKRKAPAEPAPATEASTRNSRTKPAKKEPPPKKKRIQRAKPLLKKEEDEEPEEECSEILTEPEEMVSQALSEPEEEVSQVIAEPEEEVSRVITQPEVFLSKEEGQLEVVDSQRKEHEDVDENGEKPAKKPKRQAEAVPPQNDVGVQVGSTRRNSSDELKEPEFVEPLPPPVTPASSDIGATESNQSDLLNVSQTSSVEMPILEAEITKESHSERDDDDMPMLKRANMDSNNNDMGQQLVVLLKPITVSPSSFEQQNQINGTHTASKSTGTSRRKKRTREPPLITIDSDSSTEDGDADEESGVETVTLTDEEDSLNSSPTVTNGTVNKTRKVPCRGNRSPAVRLPPTPLARHQKKVSYSDNTVPPSPTKRKPAKSQAAQRGELTAKKAKKQESVKGRGNGALIVNRRQAPGSRDYVSPLQENEDALPSRKSDRRRKPRVLGEGFVPYV